MATVTGKTAAAMQAIEDMMLVDGYRVGDSLILERGDGTLIDLGEFVTREDFDDQGPSGRELGFASSTTYQSGVAGTAVDLTSLSITFTVLNRPVYVEVDLPYVQASAATGIGAAVIADGSNVVKRYTFASFVASASMPMRVFERISTPGTYTRKAQLVRSTGTATFANNYNPATATVTSSIKATER